MDTVKVDRVRLIETMTKNRDKHAAEALEARHLYRKALLVELEKMVELAKNDTIPFSKLQSFANVPEPEDHTVEYDDQLAMLSMSIDPAIELTQMQFRQYVLDKWAWKTSFLSKTAVYNSTISGIH